MLDQRFLSDKLFQIIMDIGKDKKKLSLIKEKMATSIKHLDIELSKIRAGRSNPSMLDGIMVDYYGTKTLIGQVGNIATPDPRTITIQPWEKDIINDIKNAINISNIGLNAQDNGEMIIINVPALTEERRIELVKQVKSETENCRIAIRNSRKEGNDELKKIHKSGSISDDMLKDAESNIQDFTNQFIEKANNVSSIKETELMKV